MRVNLGAKKSSVKPYSRKREKERGNEREIDRYTRNVILSKFPNESCTITKLELNIYAKRSWH